MIYVTVGTQKFKFNRLLEYVDTAIEKEYIKDEVLAQIGHSDYEPKYYKYCDFLDKERAKDAMQNSDIIISHGGSGSIIESLKNKKKVICVCRNSDFDEHVDNHQFELVNKLANLGIILKADNEAEFLDKIANIDKFEIQDINKILDNCNIIKDIIDKYILEII